MDVHKIKKKMHINKFEAELKLHFCNEIFKFLSF